MTHYDVAVRARVVEIARQWIGTPYHHQASCKSVGCDCLGLVRGIWRELYGRDAEVATGYSADWAEASGNEALLAGAARHLTIIDVAEIAAGDVVVFRLRPNSIAKHTAIIATATANGAETMIHAMEGGPVCEVALGAWWRRRIAGAFRFSSALNFD